MLFRKKKIKKQPGEVDALFCEDGLAVKYTDKR